MQQGPSRERLESYLRLSEDVNGTLNGAKESSLRSAMRDLLGLFNSLGAEYAIIGAFAVAAYVPERRTTRDIDVVTSREHAQAILARAGEHGFSPARQAQEQLPVLRFRHRDGACLDVILDPVGFADIGAAEMVEFTGVGRLPVASAVDVALSKARTQSATWVRAPEKRIADRADLVSILRHNPGIYDELAERIRSFPPEMRDGPTGTGGLQDVLAEVAHEAGLREAPARAPAARPVWVWATLIAGAVVILALAALGLVWLLSLL